jgi:hypothetical protein
MDRTEDWEGKGIFEDEYSIIIKTYTPQPSTPIKHAGSESRRI